MTEYGQGSLWSSFVAKNFILRDDANVPIKFNLFGGLQIIRKTRLKVKLHEVLSVAMNFRSRQSSTRRISAFITTKIRWFSDYGTGAFRLLHRRPVMRWSAWWNQTGQFHLGYSYDFTISNLISSTAGAHEVSLIYEFTTFTLGSTKRKWGLFHALNSRSLSLYSI